MGKRILAFFEEADRLGGLVARMRLASGAQITSTEANTLPDRDDLLQRAEVVMKALRAEFSEPGRADGAPGVVANARSGDEQTRMLRRHLRTYLDLMAQRSLFLGQVSETVRRVTEAASLTLNVARVSVWFVEAGAEKIRCGDLFERSAGTHSAGAELERKDYVPYFAALVTERTSAAHDAHRDPRTACFSASYLKPLGISSLLDVPIWVGRAMVGVVCHEHIGIQRTWDSDEETFAYLMSNFVALALERAAPAAEALPA